MRIKSNFRILHKITLLLLASVLFLQGSIVQAQPRFRRPDPAPVPSQVVMPRPSEAELQQAETELSNFMASLNTSSKQIFEQYPYLLQVTPRGPNAAIVPSLAAGFREQHEAQVEIAKKGDIDLVFMGDSITDWWDSDRQNYDGKAVFEEYFGDLKVVTFGIAGDTTQGLLYRLQNGEGEGYKPKAVMLMIGTNNTRNNIAGEIAEGVGAIVLQLQKNFPDTKILLLGVFPRSEPDSPVRAQIAGINNIISRLHDGKKVFYKDIGDIFMEADGTIPREIMSDLLHPTAKGYRLWAEEVNDQLRSLMK